MGDRTGLERAIEASHRALDAFMHGDPEPLKALYSTGEEVSLANPFGPPVRGRHQVADRMEHAASNYQDGKAAGFERIADYVTDDLACIVEVEHLEAKVGGTSQRQPITLRVTTVFRLEDGSWKIVHRHADPIMSARPAKSVVET